MKGRKVIRIIDIVRKENSMTDKVQKIKEWISKEQEGLMDAQGNFEYPEHEGAFHILSILDAYIDSLQEEPVSEDLLKASVEFAKGFGDWHYAMPCFQAGAKWQEKKDQSTIELAEDHAMLAGMEKMKEEMMEKAVETTFNVSLPSGLYDKLWIKGCKDGDKLLVIKKDKL